MKLIPWNVSEYFGEEDPLKIWGKLERRQGAETL